VVKRHRLLISEFTLVRRLVSNNEALVLRRLLVFARRCVNSPLLHLHGLFSANAAVSVSTFLRLDRSGAGAE